MKSIKNKIRNNPLWNQLDAQLWGQFFEQLNNQLWRQLWRQLEDQLWYQFKSDKNEFN